jgi:hypothetical protein
MEGYARIGVEERCEEGKRGKELSGMSPYDRKADKDEF